MNERPRTITQVLLELEVLSHGATLTWNPSGRSRSADRNPAPQGDAYPPHLKYRDLYNQQWTDEGRERIRREADQELNELKVSKASQAKIVAEPSTVRDARIAGLQADGWTWQDIANAEKSTPSEVKKAAARHHEKQRTRAGGRTETYEQLSQRTGLSTSKLHRMFPEKRAA